LNIIVPLDAPIIKQARKVVTALRKITDGCRPDLHEPDEQGITANVVGDHLDNACGSYVDLDSLLHRHQEFVLVMKRYQKISPQQDHSMEERFNVCNLLATVRTLFGACGRLTNNSDGVQKLRVSVSGPYEFYHRVNGQAPTIVNTETGKACHFGWDDLLTLARVRGIDDGD